MTENESKRMTEVDIQAIREHERLAPSAASARIARRDIEALLSEIELLRNSEESWNKEAERHNRDHRDHYEERELIRAELWALQAAVHAAFGDQYWVQARMSGSPPMPLDEVLLRARDRLRHDHDEKCSVVVENMRRLRLELSAAQSELVLSHNATAKAVNDRAALEAVLRRIIESSAGEFRELARAALAHCALRRASMAEG